MADIKEKSDTTMADYEAKLEEREFLKREGIKEYAKILADLLGDKCDPDKLLLVQQGLAEMMMGPPRMPRMDFPPPPDSFVDAELISPMFEEFDSRNGVTRVWNWAAIAGPATHLERETDTVQLFQYQDLLITLTGKAAESFCKWLESYWTSGIISSNRHHRRRRNPRRSPA